MLKQLLETKTNDKKQTLLHFIVQTVTEKFPELRNFDSELLFIDKAAMGIFIFYNYNTTNIFI